MLSKRIRSVAMASAMAVAQVGAASLNDFINVNDNNIDQLNEEEGGGDLMTSLGNLFASRSAQTALTFLERTESNVLTIDIVQALVLLGIKTIIVVVGMSFLGSSKSSRQARSYVEQFVDDDDVGRGEASQLWLPYIRESDLTGGMCFLMYTGGLTEKLSCIQRAACEDPKTAKEYIMAAKLWYKMHTLIRAIPYDEYYNDLVAKIDEASNGDSHDGGCEIYKW